MWANRTLYVTYVINPTVSHFYFLLSPTKGIDPATWEDLAGNRSKWQKACLTGVQHFEEVRIATAVEKRSRRKGFTSQSIPAAESTDTTRPFTCDDCGRQFTVRIGLVGHSRTHRK